MKTFTNENGQYDTWAWPGGYPLFYVTKDSGILCPDCANKNMELTKDDNDPQWFIIGADINYEDNELFCDNCNGNIGAAYSV